jgi:hypothetical protein
MNNIKHGLREKLEKVASLVWHSAEKDRRCLFPEIK